MVYGLKTYSYVQWFTLRRFLTHFLSFLHKNFIQISNFLIVKDKGLSLMRFLSLKTKRISKLSDQTSPTSILNPIIRFSFHFICAEVYYISKRQPKRCSLTLVLNTLNLFLPFPVFPNMKIAKKSIFFHI